MATEAQPPNETLDELKASARRLGRAGFAQRFPQGFLVRRPPESGDRDDDDDGKNPFDDDDDSSQGTRRIAFRTNIVSQDALALDLIDSLDAVDDARWVVLPIAKRPGNPYPERVSIGRATNCDLVLRWPTVSKLHAHLHLEHGLVVRVTDCQSANGTARNGRPVGPEGSPARIGDRLRFGALECELLDAGAVFALLAAMS